MHQIHWTTTREKMQTCSYNKLIVLPGGRGQSSIGHQVQEGRVIFGDAWVVVLHTAGHWVTLTAPWTSVAFLRGIGFTLTITLTMQPMKDARVGK